MKKILVYLSFMFALLANTGSVLAETLTPDQIEIKSLIKKMYEIDPDTFEFSRFGGKYKDGEVIVRGKYNPDKKCKLLEEFLVKEAVLKQPKDVGCMSGNDGFFRYPQLDSMDLGSVTRVAPPPKPQIKSPVVNGEKAKIQVLLPTIDANVMYYLRKQPEGWRIYRVESSNSDATIENIHTRENRSQLDRIDIFPPEK